MVDGRSGPLRVLIVDDHPMVRDGLRSMLMGESIDVVGEAGTGAEALDLVETVAPDLVLLDLGLPDMDGLTVLARLKEMSRAAVLVVSMHAEPALVRRAVQAGAAGYVLKGVSRREFLAAIHAIREGESVLDPALLRALVEDGGRDGADGVAVRDSAVEPLTSIEREVLGLVAGGLTNREIGARMRWSMATAKKYVQRILEKLEVSDRTQAAVEAVRRGLLK
jgi:DNA-binding NarL/FixJ family response regulator